MRWIGRAAASGALLLGALLVQAPTPAQARFCTIDGVTIDLNALQIPGDGRVTLCHATGSAATPFVLQTVSLAACAAHLPGQPGHGQHPERLDLFPDGGCVD